MQALATEWESLGLKVKQTSWPLSGLIAAFEANGGKSWQSMVQTAGAYDPAGGVGVGFRFNSHSPFSGVHDPKLDTLLQPARRAPPSLSTRCGFYNQAAAYIAKNYYGPFFFTLAPVEHRGARRQRARAHHAAGLRRGRADDPVGGRVLQPVELVTGGLRRIPRGGLDQTWRWSSKSSSRVTPARATARAGSPARPRSRVVGRRLLAAIPVLIGVTFLTFAVMSALPNDTAQAILGLHASPSAVAALNHTLGLDQPFWQRYWHWLINVLHGNFGTTIEGTSVNHELAIHVPTTLELLLYALVVSVVLSIVVATLAARRPNGIADRISLAVSMLGLSIAPYVFAFLLIIVFAVKLNWFPVLSGPVTGPGSFFKNLTLPACRDRVRAVRDLHPAAAGRHRRADAARGLHRHRQGQGRRALAGPRSGTRCAIPCSPSSPSSG